MKTAWPDRRIVEILLMPGFVLAAIPFVGPVATRVLIARGAMLAAASLLLVLSVYSANGYFGFDSDRLNSRLQAARARGRSVYLLASLLALAFSLLLFRTIRPALPALAAAIFALWTLYSVPFGAKSRPVWGTAVHLVSQIFQFHLGIMAFSEVTAKSILVSVFFALLFSSGHLMHEVKDYECDRAAGIRTNAVAFGQRRVIAFYRKALLLLPFYWTLLYSVGAVDLRQYVPFFVGAVGHVVLSWLWDEGALRKNEPFQRIYRAIYLLAGLAALGATRL